MEEWRQLIATISGYGTILITCLQLPKPEAPIFAINIGACGFLTEVSPKEVLKALNQTLKGNYEIERTIKLASPLGETRLPDAPNEVSRISLTPAKLLKMRVWKDSELIGECQSDGAVVASQTGSTGYSLSAGGPVNDPDVQAFVFTPIAPLTVFHPIVFAANSTIHVEFAKPKTAVIVIDGHFQAEATRVLPKLSHVTIPKYESSFVRLGGDFYDRFKSRLLFSQGRVR